MSDGAAKVLGVRASPHTVHWAVVHGTKEVPLLEDHDKAEAPASFTEPQALAWYRTRFLLLIDTHRPTAVSVRYPEPVGRGGNKDSARQRSRVEGVIVEAGASRGLPVLTGALASLGKHLGAKKPKSFSRAMTFEESTSRRSLPNVPRPFLWPSPNSREMLPRA